LLLFLVCLAELGYYRYQSDFFHALLSSLELKETNDRSSFFGERSCWKAITKVTDETPGV
jgi:hypothetical protein